MALKKCLAELLGTFVLVLLGCMTVVGSGWLGFPPMLAAPFGFGLALLLAIYTVGHVSGGHFNPAVTLGMWMDHRASHTDLAGYIVAQFLGALAAAGVLLAMSGKEEVAYSTTSFEMAGTRAGFLSEFILTTLFVLVVLAVTKLNPSIAGMAIPLSLAAVHFAGIPFSGTSVNPARTLGPAVIAGEYSELWVYMIAPTAGAVMAALLWMYFQPAKDEPPETE